MIFSIYLILLTASFVYFFIHIPGQKWLKFLGTIFLLHGYLTIFSTMKDISGYPTTDSIPKTSQIIWGFAQEPNPSEDENGYIDLWVQHQASFLENNLSFFSLARQDMVSRIYRIPYTKKNHDELKLIQDRINKGHFVGITPNLKGQTVIDLADAQQQYSIQYDSIKMQK